MFEVSQELQNQLEGFNPNKLGILIHSIENVDDTDPNQLRKGIEQIKTQFGIDLLSIPTNKQKDALLALYFITESVFDVANKKTTEESTKKPRGITPAERILTDAESENNRLTNEKMALAHKERKVAEIQAKIDAKAAVDINEVDFEKDPEITLDRLEAILNPKSNAEKLDDEIKQFFLRPENAPTALLKNEFILSRFLETINFLFDNKDIHPTKILNKITIESSQNLDLEFKKAIITVVFPQTFVDEMKKLYGVKLLEKVMTKNISKLNKMMFTEMHRTNPDFKAKLNRFNKPEFLHRLISSFDTTPNLF
jgi:hypothetical protein